MTVIGLLFFFCKVKIYNDQSIQISYVLRFIYFLNVKSRNFKDISKSFYVRCCIIFCIQVYNKTCDIMFTASKLLRVNPVFVNSAQLNLTLTRLYSTVFDDKNHYDIIISGGGMVGTTLACTLGKFF